MNILKLVMSAKALTKSQLRGYEILSPAIEATFPSPQPLLSSLKSVLNLILHHLHITITTTTIKTDLLAVKIDLGDDGMLFGSWTWWWKVAWLPFNLSTLLLKI